MNYTNSSELEAINTMLGVIGESPVNSLSDEDSALSLVSIAQTTLNNTSREVQAPGYDFNSEDGFPLTADEDGFIQVPSNALKLDPVTKTDKFVVRSGKLYDKANHTFDLGDSIEVNVVWFLPFEDLPQTVRTYIIAKAARSFQMQILKSAELDQTLTAQEQMAYLEFFREEIDAGDYNIFDSQDSTALLKR